MNVPQGKSENETSSAGPAVQVRVAPGIRLSPEQVDLLTRAFAKEREILVKQEFRSGYSGAAVVLVSVGAGRAPVVAKLAHPHDLQREYNAYEEYVRQVSPQNIAHLQGEPLVGPGGQLGLLQYTFAGGESHLPTTSLQTYYESYGAEGTCAVLNRIFRVYGRHWWANNRAQSYVLDEHYDRLLPVHFQAEPAAPSSDPDHTLTAGVTGAMATEGIEIGQIVRLNGFVVTKVGEDGRKMTVLAPPPRNEASAPRRIRVETKTPVSYCPGDIVDSLTVRITATRLTLLSAAAKAAMPGFDPESATFTIPGDGGANVTLPNPLWKLAEQLYQVVETKMSIIHGDLNLQNVLVDGPTGFSWLIDFAETRIGPTLQDLQRLEVQVITKLMPSGSDIAPALVVDMMSRLHADPPMPAPSAPALQEPYAVLATIRRLARQYLIDDMDWNEYYRGLAVALVGALKYDELDGGARRWALISAATVDKLIGMPWGTDSIPVAQTAHVAASVLPVGAVGASRAPERAEPSQSKRRWAGMAIAAGALVLIAWAGWQFASRQSTSEDNPPSATTPTLGVEVAANASPSPLASDTPETVAASGASATDTPVTATVEGDLQASVDAPQATDAAAAPTDTVNAEAEEPATLLPATLLPTTPVPTETGTPEPASVVETLLPEAPAAGATQVSELDRAVYIFVPAGAFTMGTDRGEADEGPAHTVELDAYWIMRSETTNGQYRRCVAAGACTAPANELWDDPEFADHPVTHVTWEQASEYAAWVGGRLPTEAEWEKAARGTDQRAYPWGNAPTSNDLLNFNFAAGTTAPAGSYPEGASPYGGLDMAGNVEEWVADRYDIGYYAASPGQNPQGPEAGPFRAVRGGSYYSNGMDVRTFAREKAFPSARFDSVGFRVVMPEE